jgi:hypothetical protein
VYYKHSGHFSPGGLVLGALAGGIAALILPYAYAHGLILISEAHLAAFATIAFGALVGAATAYGLILGKVRNQPVTLALSGVASALALYISWCVWITAIVGNQGGDTVSWIELFQQPHAIWNAMLVINQYGTWTLSGNSPTTGWELWAYWILEAATVIGAAMFAALALMNHRPFCEACDQWCSGSAKIILAPPQNVQQLKLQVEANDLRPLENLGPGSKATSHLTVKLNSCEHCRQFHTISLTNCTVTKSKWGQPKVSNKMVVQQLVVGVGQAETIRQLSGNMTPVNASPQAKGAIAGKR